MTAPHSARYLRALAEAADSRRLEGGEDRPVAGPEPCLMPTVGGPCSLDGDHEGACHPVPPKCLCAHSAWRHVSERGHCRRPGCGCTTYRTGGAA